MMGGVNVAAAVAIPVVLVLLLLVVGVVVTFALVCTKNGSNYKKLSAKKVQILRMENTPGHVFSQEIDVNKWEILFSIPKRNESLSADVKFSENDCVEVQNVTEGWILEKQQEYNAEILNIVRNDENQQPLDTTKFVVSSTQTSPDDLSFSVTINGGQTPQTVTVEKKASRRCVCQVLYHREGINWWKIRFALFSEHLLAKVQELYKDILNGPKVYFYFRYEVKDIDLFTKCETSMWHIVEGSKSLKVSRAAVESYTGESEPPCIVMTLRAVSDKTKPPDLTLPVTLTGVRKPNNIIVIERPADDLTWHVCQVFYHKIGINNWTATLAFCHKKKLEVVKEHYQNATDIGPIIDLSFYISTMILSIGIEYTDATDGWSIESDKQCQKVYKDSMTGYKKGTPPCIVMSLRAVPDEITPPDLTIPVTLTGVREPNNIILIERTAEDPTLCVCQVFYHKKGSNNWTVILAFCQKNKFDKMKKFYQDADIGPAIDVNFKPTSHITPNIRKITGGWTLVPDNQLKLVNRAAVEGYTGEGEPPCIVMTLIATNKTVSMNANFTVTLDGVQPPNTTTITRPSDPANFQMKPSTDDDDDRFSKSYAGTEHKAEKDLDKKSGRSNTSI